MGKFVRDNYRHRNLQFMALDLLLEIGLQKQVTMIKTWLSLHLLINFQQDHKQLILDQTFEKSHPNE